MPKENRPQEKLRETREFTYRAFSPDSEPPEIPEREHKATTEDKPEEEETEQAGRA